MTAVDLLHLRYDGRIPPGALAAAEAADAIARKARKPRARRLERIYDRAYDRSIGSTDGRTLANATLSHWLYCRAIGDYDADKMRDDCLNLLARAQTHSRRLQWAARLAGADALPMAAE